MASGVSAGSAYLEILPSLRGFGGRLSDQLDPDATKAGEQAGKKSGEGFKGKFGEGLKGIGAIAAGAFAVDKALEFGKEAISAASDLSESQSKVGVVFGTASKQIIDASDGAARAVGLSKQAYLEATGGLGNLLVALKVTPKAAADMSQKMVGLAGDLASFNNTSPEEALDALRAGLTGETEPLKRYGVNISAAAVQAEALKEGLVKSVKEGLTPQAKALATQALIFDQTKTAQGDFARTSSGLANQQRILSAELEDVKAKVGSVLIPVMIAGANILTGVVIPAFSGLGATIGTVAGFVMDHKTAFEVIAGVIVTLLLPAFVSMATSAVVTAATTVIAWGQIVFWAGVGAAAQVAAAVITVAQWVLMGAQALLQAARMAAAWLIAIGPIALVIAAVVGLAILIFKNWDMIKRVTVEVWQAVVDFIMGVVDSVVGFVRDHWKLFLEILTGPIGLAVGVIAGHWDTIKGDVKAAFDWVKTKIEDVWGSSITFLSDGVDRVVGFFTALPGRISGLFGGMFDGIKDAFRSAINWVIDGWNRLQFHIPGVDTHIPGVGKIGDFTLGTPDIPRLAAGGIVNKPTIALIGEAGPEAVIPLSKGRGLGGGSLTIVNQGRDVGPSTVVQALSQYETIHGHALLAGTGIR
jgi:hypothetical protein